MCYIVICLAIYKSIILIPIKLIILNKLYVTLNDGINKFITFEVK